jgi:hypothetical protein
MSDPLPLGPLPEVGPPTGQQQDGSEPGMTYSSGTWCVRNGQLVNVPPFLPPGGFDVK